MIINAHTVYAGFWRRTAAACIDTILLLLLTVIILYGWYGPDYFDWFMANEELFASYGAGQVLTDYFLPIILTVFLWVKFLGTPGKLLMGCVVVDANTGNPLTVGQAILRYFSYFISALPLMLGILWIVWDRRKQGFHDKIAKTVVVLEDEAESISKEIERGWD